MDKAVELELRVEPPEHPTIAYFEDLSAEAHAEELELESALSAVSKEFDFDEA